MTATLGSHSPTPLARLAHAVGVATEWTDAFGHPRHVPAETLERILTALGFTCGTRRDIAASATPDDPDLLAHTTLVFLEGAAP